MTTEFNINKYMDATVHSDSVLVRDEQHGEIALDGETFERLYEEYLREQNNSPFIEEK